MENCRVLGNFFSLHIQNLKDPHKISFSEPVALFMKFPTCVGSNFQGNKIFLLSFMEVLDASYISLVSMVG